MQIVFLSDVRNKATRLFELLMYRREFCLCREMRRLGDLLRLSHSSFQSGFCNYDEVRCK